MLGKVEPQIAQGKKKGIFLRWFWFCCKVCSLEVADVFGSVLVVRALLVAGL